MTFAVAAVAAVGFVALPIALRPYGSGAPVAGAVAAGVLAGAALRREAAAILTATLIASVVLGSPLVSADVRYWPVASGLLAMVVALLIRVAREGLPIRVPEPAIAIALAAYALVAAWSVVGSIEPLTSLTYVVGVIGVLGVTFVVAPTLLGDDLGRTLLLAFAGIAVMLAIASVVFLAVGAVVAPGGVLGLYFITEILVAGERTGLVIPRASGIYATPGYQAIALAVGVLALLALRPLSTPAARRTWAVLLMVVIIALLATMARGGWLIAVVGALFLSALSLRRRTIDAAALGTTVVMGLLLVALLGDVLAAGARYDIAVRRYPAIAALDPADPVFGGKVPGAPATPGEGPSGPGAPGDEVEVRGGAESASRMVLWRASLDAVIARPVFGYGIGTDAQAIAPLLTGDNRVYRGLTSHSTWLRTAVELGLAGLAALVVVVLLALRRGILSLRGTGSVSAVSGLLVVSAGLFVGTATETLLLGGTSYDSLAWVAMLGGLTASAARVIDPKRVVESMGRARAPGR
jgi:hypothetical protein